MGVLAQCGWNGVINRNGMDAPTRNGISCAKVEELLNHLNREERPP